MATREVVAKDEADLFNTTVAPRYQNIPGWLSLDEAYALWSLARNLPENSVVVEIGSHLGKSTVVLALGVQAKGGRVYAVDPWTVEGCEDGSALKTEVYGRTNRLYALMQNTQGLPVLACPGMSVGVARAFSSFEPRKVNMLFIDGDHRFSGVDADFTAWTPKLAVGGVLAMHDVYPEVQPVNDERGPWDVVQQQIEGTDWGRDTSWEDGILIDSLYLTSKRWDR